MNEMLQNMNKPSKLYAEPVTNKEDSDDEYLLGDDNSYLIPQDKNVELE